MRHRAFGSLPVIVLHQRPPGLIRLEFMGRHRQTQHTSVVTLAARTGAGDRAFGLAFGADDDVTKPVGPRGLVARLEAVARGDRGGR